MAASRGKIFILIYCILERAISSLGDTEDSRWLLVQGTYI